MGAVAEINCAGDSSCGAGKSAKSVPAVVSERVSPFGLGGAAWRGSRCEPPGRAASPLARGHRPDLPQGAVGATPAAMPSNAPPGCAPLQSQVALVLGQWGTGRSATNSFVGWTGCASPTGQGVS
eukprot:GHVT01024456.1.p1 GENE.GHVT01024456.1~~GHVT01024456.1.p1  ORF type:complete len:125 (+),score=13.35 GHVT01024456.1:1324-1698(+)